MSSNDLRLQVVLQTIDKASAVLKKISGGSSEAARALAKTRSQLKELNAQQRQVGEFRELKGGLKETAAKLSESQAKVAALARQISLAGVPTKAMIRDFKAAKAEAASLGEAHSAQSTKVQALRDKLSQAGISTKNLAAQDVSLRANIKATTMAIADQTAKLQAQAIQQKKLAELKAAHGKEMMRTGMVAAAGVASVGAGSAMLRPVRSAIEAFVPNEDSATQLRGALMRADGSVPREFQKISDLATRLGDKLPGTTADFQEMMTMLIRQGISAKAVLGGVGESASYLGVQLKMPVPAAAEFAAKMQDATHTVESDMMGLMDVIQRTFYLGVDSGNMLQGFTKISPVMSIMRKEGLAAAKDLAPLLVMMDQTGMAGESAGNALRKVFQAGLDAKKVAKANASTGTHIKFTDAKGNFAGLDNLFVQLSKIKAIEGDSKRVHLIKTIFGDDAETLQVLTTLMDKGMSGYKEIAAKMEAQASLRQRVNQQLATVKAGLDTAEGNFTNMMSDIGATVAPELKSLLQWLGEIANKVGQFARENPAVVSAMVKFLAVLAAIAITCGTVAIGIASIMGPIFLLRFGLGMLGIQGITAMGTMRGLATGIALVGRALLMNPIGLAVTGIVGGAMLIYKYWEPITAWFSRITGSKSPTAALSTPLRSAAVAAAVASAASSPAGASPMRFDSRAPLKPATAASAAGDTNHFVINPPPGSSPEAIARAVSAELDRRDRAKRAAGRSALTDN
jgi:TP901 family phage tail tape measure protein